MPVVHLAIRYIYL